MNLTTKLRLRQAAVWIARAIVGITFILSGWAKAIDPWGFTIKVGEYLAAWGMEFPHEVVLAGCVLLACIEFSTGIMVAAGAFKRTAVWVAAAMIAVMLPLTAYIALYNPVSDCGCFGDFYVISNTATLLKNVALTAIIVYLILRNHTVPGLFPAPIQWLVVIGAWAYPMFLAFVGYTVQPMVDFRPYPNGTVMFRGEAAAETSSPDMFIYEKDGRRQSFTFDNLPDSTWTFVDADVNVGANDGIAVHEPGEDYDISEELVDSNGPQLFLIVPDPGVQFLSRSHYVNTLAAYCSSHGVEMLGVVGASGAAAAKWVEWTRPSFDVYQAEDTSLQQLVRGNAGLVYTENGRIVWKRNLASMDAELPESDTFLEEISPVDDGRLHAIATGVLGVYLLIIYLLGLSPKILRLFIRHK